LAKRDPTKSTWNLWDDLPPEEEDDELIEKLAQNIIKRRMGLMAQLTLETISPISKLGADLGMTLLGPYLEFFGVEKVTALFRKRANLTRLLDRIDELEMEKSRKREEAKRKKREEKSKVK
jgi:hypothetical protein